MSPVISIYNFHHLDCCLRMNPESSSSNERRKQFYYCKINDILDFKNKQAL